MQKTMIIIGAGIGGLSTGCYAQMSGYTTRIFEMHDKPGGVCTSWHRNGYTFDGCIHNLVGTRPGSKVRRMWEELGVDRRWEVVDFKEFVQVEDADGKTLTVHADPSRFERHLMDLSPADAPVIKELMKGLRAFSRIDMLSMPAGGIREMLGMAVHGPLIARWMAMDLERFSKRFKDPFLRRAFPTIQYDLDEVPVGISLSFLGGLGRGDLGYPKGGSLEFSRTIARRYAELGGEIAYGSPVEKVICEKDRAVGVRLSDGSEHRADRIVSNADGRSTILGMLDGRYMDGRIRAYYEKPLVDHQQFALQVSFGIARDLSREPHSIVLFLTEPLTIAGETKDRLDLELFGFDPSLAPAGKSVLKVILDSRYAYWKELSRDPGSYKAEKKRVVETLLPALERRFPGFIRQVEVTDVSTPVTTERITGNWQGLQSWPPKGVSFLSVMRKGFTKTLPGLKGFSMVGQWASCTIGISTAALMGKRLVKELCAQDGLRFRTSV
jgi:phytoene dehydrogenase-like protein